MSIPVSFYLSPEQWHTDWPDRYDLDWPHFGDGHYNWILQSFLKLREAGVPCQLTNELPDQEGIVIAHRRSLHEDYQPSAGQLLVCVQADWGRHPHAQVHVCQNAMQAVARGQHKAYRWFWPGKTRFVHHWPQPQLIPRRASRAPELRCLAYFGLDYNLTPQLRSHDWHRFLEGLGIEWRIVDAMSDWGNFKEIDAVVFIRDFEGQPYFNKPATKLQNAWAAGCVPVCTPESAFVHEASLDSESVAYVDSFEALKTAISRMSEDPDHFRARLEAVHAEAGRIDEASIVEEWKQLLLTLQLVDFPYWCTPSISHSVRRFGFRTVRSVLALALAAGGRLKP